MIDYIAKLRDLEGRLEVVLKQIPATARVVMPATAMEAETILRDLRTLRATMQRLGGVDC